MSLLFNLTRTDIQQKTELTVRIKTRLGLSLLMVLFRSCIKTI